MIYFQLLLDRDEKVFSRFWRKLKMKRMANLTFSDDSGFFFIKPSLRAVLIETKIFFIVSILTSKSYCFHFSSHHGFKEYIKCHVVSLKVKLFSVNNFHRSSGWTAEGRLTIIPKQKRGIPFNSLRIIIYRRS